MTDNPEAKNVNRRNTKSSPTWMEAILTLIAKMSPTGRKVKAIAAKERIADGYPDEIEIPTRITLLETPTAKYRTLGPNECG